MIGKQIYTNNMETELMQILENAEKPKISIIMQVLLEDYPGARANAIDKFRRAVKSYQAQLYKNTELILVSDGCNKTYQIYSREFKSDPSIKFILVDRKNTPKMYEDLNGEKYYRGFPRRAGVGIATGDLITYMDADDYITPHHTLTWMLAYNSNPDAKWWINRSWYDNDLANWPESNIFYPSSQSPGERLDGIDDIWRKTKLKDNAIILSPWLFMHRADCDKIKWMDTKGISEDVYFIKQFRSLYKEGSPVENATYVRCHYTEQWDV